MRRTLVRLTKIMTVPNMTKIANMTADGQNMTTFSAEELKAHSECLRSETNYYRNSGFAGHTIHKKMIVES